MSETRKLRMGMVGGGPGAFIGPVHKMAAELDGQIEMVAGAFSQSAERSRAAGEHFKIDPERAYAGYEEMLKAERERPDAIDFVVIATPNHLHLPVAKAALEAGFAVMSDKPATATYDEVLQLEALVKKAGLPYGLTHTYAGYSLVEYVTQARVTGLNAALRTVVPGRRLDDDCNALLRMENGATGTLMASQVAAGEGNGLRLRVYGEKGSIEWHQEDPNRLRVKWEGGPEEVRYAAGGYLSPGARAVTRLPGGHPEGYVEAFAVLYREFAEGLTAWKAGKADPLPETLPGIVAGVRGMRFIERAIESSRTERWVEF